MTQQQLNRAVSRATGEDLATIANLGFSTLHGGPFKREPLVIDWDERDSQQRVSYLPQVRDRDRSLASHDLSPTNNGDSKIAYHIHAARHNESARSCVGPLVRCVAQAPS